VGGIDCRGGADSVTGVIDPGPGVVAGPNTDILPSQQSLSCLKTMRRIKARETVPQICGRGACFESRFVGKKVKSLWAAIWGRS
jgi:hypothetical protein